MFFVRILVIFLLLLNFQAQASTRKTKAGKSHKILSTHVEGALTDQPLERLVLDALDFYETDDDREAFVKLAQRTGDLRSPMLVRRVTQFYLKNKDRTGLYAYFKMLAKNLNCNEAPQLANQKSCTEIGVIWKNNLDSVSFYEDSASKFEKLRRLLVAKDCSSALPVLKEIQAHEGVFRPVLEAQLRLAECSADVATKEKVLRDLEELRLFAGE